ncbi:hypothetical protein LTR56_016474 [Elasticomyces elasticus]|nr:hypothetical protein LTR56_016474 [Elasticomyces elasticus]KAK3633480.1 hypothetical protein LTR22_020100 [Elasticomyces elasticus]
MPSVHGAIALYDVQDKNLVEDISEVLDPAMIEQKALRSISGISTLQMTRRSPHEQRKAIFMIVEAVILGHAEASKSRSSLPMRKRAQSNGVRPISPQPLARIRHARANREYTGSISSRDQKHARHDMSLAGYGSSNQLEVANEVSEMDVHKSFLAGESVSDGSYAFARSSLSAHLVA